MAAGYPDAFPVRDPVALCLRRSINTSAHRARGRTTSCPIQPPPIRRSGDSPPSAYPTTYPVTIRRTNPAAACRIARSLCDGGGCSGRTAGSRSGPENVLTRPFEPTDADAPVVTSTGAVRS